MTRPRLAPTSAAKGVAYRLAMARAIPRLPRERDRSTDAVAAALRAGAGGRLDPAERAWQGRIEARRARLMELQRTHAPADVGIYRIADAVRWMSVPPSIGRLLMKLVRELEPGSCLEVGTGLGLSGAYHGAALELNGHGRLLTLDVVEVHAEHAREGFAELGLGRVEARAGEAEELLRSALADAAPIDYALVDADHREEPTVSCFEAMLPHLAEGAVVVFDDVGFSLPEMARAWRAIAGNERVSVALPVGRLGIAVIAGRR